MRDKARDSADFDVVITGGGPAGLAAAIRIKQCARAAGREISVCLVEKGAAIGAHLISGAILDPAPLDSLLPGWRNEAGPCDPVQDEAFCFLTERHAMTLPRVLLPPPMRHEGGIIVSLGRLARMLKEVAENLGVEMYPGFAAAVPCFDEAGALAGIVTGDFGLARDGSRKSTFAAGMELKAKYTLIAEGARGHLAETLIARFRLNADRDPQKFALGLKELWRLAPRRHRRGLTLHALGWPLDNETGGGMFAYHWGEDICSIGLTVHLDYRNPHLSPFREFQRAKRHPLFRAMLEDGRRIGFGARAVACGGVQSLPRLAFAGGALIGDAAGFYNLPRTQGIHGALISGILAGEATARAIMSGRARDRLSCYEAAFEHSALHDELKQGANAKPLWSRFGTVLGLTLAGMDLWSRALFGISPIPRLSHRHGDHQSLRPSAQARPITYPKPDGRIDFDRNSSLHLANIRHAEDQPMHLRLADPDLPLRRSLREFGAPERLYCPAGVYEMIETAGGPCLHINAANCLHCKACEIKDPYRNIRWLPPEGGSGPAYADM